MKKKSTKYLVDACLRTKELMENNRKEQTNSCKLHFQSFISIDFWEI